MKTEQLAEDHASVFESLANEIKNTASKFKKEKVTINGKTFDVVVVPKGTIFFHWSSDEIATRRIQQGKIDAGEMGSLRRGEGRVGGGFYASMNPHDSIEFGEKLLVAELSKEVKLILGQSVPRQDELLRAGISGITRYYDGEASTWTNFISEEPLQNIRNPNLDDFKIIKGLPAGAVYLDQIFPNERNIKLDHSIVSRFLKNSIKGDTALPIKQTDKLKKACNELIQEKSADVKKIHEKSLYELFEIYLAEDIRSGNFLVSKEKLVMPAGKNPLGDGGKVDPFLGKFLSAFEFIDLKDMVLAMAQGHKEPWNLYDQGNVSVLDVWNKPFKYGLLDIVKAASGGVIQGFRDHRVIVGGPIDAHGVIIEGDTSHDQSYFRVNEKELKVLQSNRLLSVEMVNDPKPPNLFSKSFLVRYEYPSAAKFDGFFDLLTDGLKKQLVEAKAAGHLKQESSEQFKSLTKAILLELMIEAKNKNLNAATRYQAHIAIHPFSDLNGRALRKAFLNHVGFPLFLADWDKDLMLSPEDFCKEVYKGLKQLRYLKSTYTEYFFNNPNAFKDYYKIPTPAAILSGLSPDYPFLGQIWDELLRFVKTFQGERSIKRKMSANWVEDWRLNFVKFASKLPKK